MRVLLGLILLASFSGCQIFGEDLDDSTGAFDYVARDADGTVVAEGSLMFTFAPIQADDSCRPSCPLFTVSGQSKMTAKDRSQHYFSGSSTTVDGRVQADSQLVVLLASELPGFELRGRFDDRIPGSFSGTWAPCGFAGCLPAGTFTATR